MFLLPAGASGYPGIPTNSVTPIIYGTQGANGWYVTNVTINGVIEPLGYTESDGCDAHTVAADTVGTPFTCHVEWGPTEITRGVTISRDATPPTVTVVPARGPDANGWYNHALTVSFTGSDATSGIDACSQATYG